MSTETLIIYTLKGLLLPPGLNLLLALLAWILWKSWRRVARGLLLVSTISLFALSIPSISSSLMASLQTQPALSLKQLTQLSKEHLGREYLKKESNKDKLTKEETDQTALVEKTYAIVILGGGRRHRAPEFNDTDTLHARTLERVRYGAFLHRQTQWPILVSGGKVFGEGTSEAVIMNQVLTEEFKTPATWLEVNSRNTLENAQQSVVILEQQNIGHILLVTHAWHMERALQVFQQTGLTVIPAPTAFVITDGGRQDRLNYLPSAKALHMSFLALHEYLGRLWYYLIQ